MTVSDKDRLLSTLQVLSDIRPDEPEEQGPSGVDVADDVLFLLGMNVPLDGFDSPLTEAGEVNPDAKKTLYTQVERALNELVACGLVENIAPAAGPDTLDHMLLCITNRGNRTLDLLADLRRAAANRDDIAFRQAQLERMLQIEDERYGNRDLFSTLG